MKQSDEAPKGKLWQLTGLGLAIFLGVVVAAVAVAEANVVTPALGDIVSIKAGTEVPGPLRADIEVRGSTRTASRAAAACCNRT